MRGFTVLLAAALLLLASLEAAGTSTISYEEETRRMFVEWKADYGKTYKDVGEEECRRGVLSNLEMEGKLSARCQAAAAAALELPHSVD
ncbi:hypothetical protein HU200_053285 [Digitaria exilis]|uniref:Cathepsin propeptide inhibitor domain-containing protein n=1 Tax=Digitaria exilis TaxID=1010633 RepID=A0A835APM2_9POAL|nr:hypothetical protein HU200_053285 [Digitaria exilis]